MSKSKDQQHFSQDMSMLNKRLKAARAKARELEAELGQIVALLVERESYYKHTLDYAMNLQTEANEVFERFNFLEDNDD